MPGLGFLHFSAQTRLCADSEALALTRWRVQGSNALAPALAVTRSIVMTAPLLFSTIEVTRQVFYRTALSYAIVNLKPIVPGRESLMIFDQCS
jgi:hypothetical protein